MADGLQESKEITIQRMEPGEKAAVRKLAYRSFPLIQRLFISFSPDVFTAKLRRGKR